MFHLFLAIHDYSLCGIKFSVLVLFLLWISFHRMYAIKSIHVEVIHQRHRYLPDEAVQLGSIKVIYIPIDGIDVKKVSYFWNRVKVFPCQPSLIDNTELCKIVTNLYLLLASSGSDGAFISCLSDCLACWLADDLYLQNLCSDWLGSESNALIML